MTASEQRIAAALEKIMGQLSFLVGEFKKFNQREDAKQGLQYVPVKIKDETAPLNSIIPETMLVPNRPPQTPRDLVSGPFIELLSVESPDPVTDTRRFTGQLFAPDGRLVDVDGTYKEVI